MASLVALAGFMGSGKSSVGSLLARTLNRRFVDLDEEVAREAGMSIPELFARFGEADFRGRESRTLEQILSATADPQDEGLVIALGGGTLQTPQASAMLEERGGVVFLDLEATTAWERARGQTRPLAQDSAAFEALLSTRRPTYERVADWLVPVGRRSAEEVATEIAEIVSALGPAWATSWGLRLGSTARPSTIVGGARSLGALSGFAQRLRQAGSRPFVVTDANVEAAWGPTVRGRLGPEEAVDRTLVLDAGEQTKTAQNLERVWDWLASRGARREDVVVALGGGVIGDLAGFAAATYQRGVGLWQVPTTLLAQVDSSIGGKTAVNLTSGKNLVGAFYQPQLVVIDPDTLSTLPEEEYGNGLGEVVKYGLLVGNGLLTLLEQLGKASPPDAVLMSEIVKTCVRYKAQVVEEDEFDTGRRAVLNLGHTTAHALEATLGYGRIGHGEAVALGLLVALAVSEKLLALPPDVRVRTQDLLRTMGLRTTIMLPPTDAIVSAAGRDKKATAVSANFVGLRELGRPVWGLDVPGRVFEEALEVIRA